VAYGATGNLIEGNKISDNAMHGICLNDADDIYVVGNEASNSSNFGIEVVSGSSGNLVYENKVSDSGWNGIALRSDADYNYVLENSVSSSTNIGILVKMSTHNLIYGNKVSHSGLWDLCDSSSPPPLANTWRDNKYKTSNF